MSIRLHNTLSKTSSIKPAEFPVKLFNLDK